MYIGSNYNVLAISAYQYLSCEFESRSGRGVRHYVIKFVNDLRQVGGFFPGPPFSSINKTDRQDITDVLLKLLYDIYTINTIKQ